MTLEIYERFKLADFLRDLRRPGRYPKHQGHHVLTNAVADRGQRSDEVREALREAHDAGEHAKALRWRLACRITASAETPAAAGAVVDAIIAREIRAAHFVSALENSGLGLARGLNPYSDWTLSMLQGPPKAWLLVVGLDWYPISELGNGDDWEAYLDALFDYDRFGRDPFWHNVWAWLLDRRAGEGWGLVTPEEAAAFIVAQRLGIVFHNVIPYLRPPWVGKSDKTWPKNELARPGMEQVFQQDLATLRLALEKTAPVVAVCTSGRTQDVLLAAKFAPEAVFNWRRHPSNVFHPSTVKNLPFAAVRAALKC